MIGLVDQVNRVLNKGDNLSSSKNWHGNSSAINKQWPSQHKLNKTGYETYKI